MDFCRALFDEGVMATGIAFPTVPEGKARIRIILTSEHTRRATRPGAGDDGARGEAHGDSTIAQQMIAHLRGKLIHKQPGQAIVEAAGVGYDVAISVPTFTALPSRRRRSVAAHSHPGQRRPDCALRLSRSRREAALRAAHHCERRRAEAGHQNAERALSRSARCRPFAAQDHAQLTRIPGVGKKLAERLVVELKDKLDDFAVAPAQPSVQGPAVDDVLSALTNLGYQRAAARRPSSRPSRKIKRWPQISTACSAGRSRSSGKIAAFSRSLFALSLGSYPDWLLSVCAGG